MKQLSPAQNQHNGRRSKCERVYGRNVIPHASEQSAQPNRTTDADHETGEHHSQAIVQNQPNHIAWLTAYRQPNADLSKS